MTKHKDLFIMGFFIQPSIFVLISLFFYGLSIIKSLRSVWEYFTHALTLIDLANLLIFFISYISVVFILYSLQSIIYAFMMCEWILPRIKSHPIRILISGLIGGISGFIPLILILKSFNLIDTEGRINILLIIILCITICIGLISGWIMSKTYNRRAFINKSNRAIKTIT